MPDSYVKANTMGVCLIHVEFVVLAMSVLASLIYMIATWVAKKDTFDGACFLFAEWDAESQSASNPIAASCNVVIFSAFPSIAIAVVATVANVVTLVRIRKGRRYACGPEVYFCFFICMVLSLFSLPGLFYFG